MKKFFVFRKALLLTIFASVLFIIAACGNGDAASGESVELTFVRIGSDQAETDHWRGVIDRFEAENENIRILYDNAAIGEPMETMITTMFAGGMGPDIIGHGILSVAARVAAGHYMPITDFFREWEGRYDITPSLLANGYYQGEIYGLAYSATPFLFAYRRDMLEEAGLDGPPRTWDELMEYAELLTQRDANGNITIAGFAFPMTAGNFVEFDVFVFGNNGRFFYEDELMMNTPDKVEAFEFLIPLVNNFNMPFSAGDINPFITGTAAMTLINNVALRPMLDNPEFEGLIGVALPPYNSNNPLADPMTFSGSNMFFVGTDTNHPELAFSFIEFALSVDEVLNRAYELNIPVTRNSTEPEFFEMDEMNIVRTRAVANGIGMPRVTWSPTFQRLRNEMVQEILFGGADIQDTLDRVQAEIEREMD